MCMLLLYSHQGANYTDVLPLLCPLACYACPYDGAVVKHLHYLLWLNHGVSGAASVETALGKEIHFCSISAPFSVCLFLSRLWK